VTPHGGIRFENPQGAVHTGSGDIHFVDVHQGPEPERPVFRARAEDQLKWLRRVLVPPSGMGAARALLETTGTVVLDAPPGSGRTAAAQVLLREHRQDLGVFHELLPDEEDEPKLHDPALVGAGDRLLLMLGGADDRQWSAIRGDLPALRKAVLDQRAHLVVVMPHGGFLEPDLQRYRVALERPSARQVFRRHLREHGLPYQQYMTPDPSVVKFLEADRPMDDIAAFADLVRRARDAAPSETYAQWCASALRARGSRRPEIAGRVAKQSSAPQRALLITVSMLHGAHADVVHRAAGVLLGALGPESDEGCLLTDQDLAERLKEISAEAGPAGQVRFKGLDEDQAVRAHVWDHLPDLRPHLGTWVERVVDLHGPQFDEGVKDSLVHRLAEQYLRTGHGDGLAALAERWGTRESAGRARLDACFHALACGLQDPAHGRDFRARVYDWCRGSRTPQPFAGVLVRVCVDVIASRHPDQALLRLYYLARQESSPRRPALQALDDFVAGNRRLRRRLLARLARSGIEKGDARVFLQVCDPVPLTDDTSASRALLEESEVRGFLAVGWQAVLAELPGAVWRPLATHWLHRAGEPSVTCGELLLDVLVDAAGRCGRRRGQVFAALYATARTAEPTAPAGSGAATSALLIQKIGEAQRRGPAAAAPAQDREARP
jgi:hypothetical protein